MQEKQKSLENEEEDDLDFDCPAPDLKNNSLEDDSQESLKSRVEKALSIISKHEEMTEKQRDMIEQ